MSFANEWLTHLKNKNRMIYYIKLIGDRPEDMLHTGISVSSKEVEQIYHNPRLAMEVLRGVPDKIGIKPLDVKSVEIETDEGFTFTINKDRTMKVRYADYSGRGFSPEKERVIYREARNHGYNVVEFMQTDV